MCSLGNSYNWVQKIVKVSETCKENGNRCGNGVQTNALGHIEIVFSVLDIVIVCSHSVVMRIAISQLHTNSFSFIVLTLIVVM